MVLSINLRRIVRRLRGRNDDRLAVTFVRRGGWLGKHLPARIDAPRLPDHETIERRAAETNAAGERPIWQGYASVPDYARSTEGGRTSDQVRTDAATGRFYSWLVGKRRSELVVEIGTAFGVSGMYWLAGLAGSGQLFTFDPNTNWVSFARENLAAVGRNFTLTNDTFEHAGPDLLQPGTVDIAFIDAIHTSDFVFPQFEVLRPLMQSGGIVVFDDIDFSPDMRSCWSEIASNPEWAASTTIGRRVGIIELGQRA